MAPVRTAQRRCKCVGRRPDTQGQASEQRGAVKTSSHAVTAAKRARVFVHTLMNDDR